MDEMNIGRFLFSTFAVLGLIGLFAFVLKRFAHRIPGGTMASSNVRIRILEVRPVGPRQKLLLVKFDDKEHLLYVGQEAQMMIESKTARDDATIAGQ